MSEAPNRRDRLRPVELLGLAGGLALFVGLVTIIATRTIELALIGLGVTFILSIVVLATLALMINPPSDEEKQDLEDQDNGH
jgi:hypothetical protein